MPTLQRLADGGLTYSQWHTTALCSPTRSTFLTGRNHHSNGFASISESSTGFPGYSSHIPPENGTLAHVLRDAGYSTFWVGKNHNILVDAWTQGSSKKEWPLGMGFDRFYGFIGGETNNWYPDLAADNHYVDRPYLPEDGYHLSNNLADQALRFIRDSKQSEPDKRGICGSVPAPTMRRTTAPRTTSTSTRASSTTAMRPTASGCSRG
jgi:arylsulfatase A-like enzyme